MGDYKPSDQFNLPPSEICILNLFFIPPFRQTARQVAFASRSAIVWVWPTRRFVNRLDNYFRSSATCHSLIDYNQNTKKTILLSLFLLKIIIILKHDYFHDYNPLKNVDDSFIHTHAQFTNWSFPKKLFNHLRCTNFFPRLPLLTPRSFSIVPLFFANFIYPLHFIFHISSSSEPFVCCHGFRRPLLAHYRI